LDFEEGFKDYYLHIFQLWKTTVNSNYTTSQLGLAPQDIPKFVILKDLIESNNSEESEKPFNFSEFKYFVRFLETFGLISSHLKPNLAKFFMQKLGYLLDLLILESESESEEDDDSEDVQGQQKNYQHIMPYVQVYITAYIKLLCEKIDIYREEYTDKNKENEIFVNEIRNMKKPSKFSTKFLESVDRDIKYIFIKKLGSKILDLALDMPNSVNQVKEIGEYVKKVKMTEELCLWLRESILKRLLSPGVTTYNILTSYFRIVETLGIIDPDMLNFRVVTGPVKKFLLKRSDLIRCIINFWKGERG
jgi:hypothetical protein